MSLDLNLDEATQTWDRLAEHLDTFIASWEHGPAPPVLAEHLPDGPAGLRRLALVELIKVDLEYRWRQGHFKPLEQYLAEYPELQEGAGPPCDLIYEEYHVRKAAGEAIGREDYLERFPRQAEALGRLLALESPERTTTLSGSLRGVELQAGGRVDDFELLVRLGQGAFATVFLARQCSLQRLVALKISADRGVEAQTLAQLDHPYIVRVYDQRQFPAGKQRLLYMQYVPGGTLQAVVQRVRSTPPAERTGRLLLETIDAALRSAGQEPSADSPLRRQLAAASWPEVVCRLGAQLAEALDYAHGHSVLHRDVKPANVLLSAEGVPMLADFNISFCSQLECATPAAYFGGSLAYMSPEQLEACHPGHPRQAEQLDARSDLYSLGVLLWELLYGQRPLGDERLALDWLDTLRDMAERRRAGPPPRPRPVDAPAGELFEPLREILEKCLAADPERRYTDGRQLAQDLLLCLQPRAWRLLHPGLGWRQLIAGAPLLAVLLAALPPHLLAGVFNYWYNKHTLVAALEDAQAAFWNIQAVINSIAYPLGVLLVWLILRPVSRGLRRLAQGQRLDEPCLLWLRRHALRLGHYVALIAVAEWLIAGLAYPASLHGLVAQFPPGTLLPFYLHFLGSLAVCGLIAAAYPFFAVTLLSVRVFYPRLLRQATSEPGAEQQLIRLAGQTGWYLLIAAGVPMLALALLVLSGSEDRLTLSLLILAGLLGLAVSFRTHRVIQQDVAALRLCVRPAESLGAAVITQSSTWTRKP